MGHELKALLLQACPRSCSVCKTEDLAGSSEAQLSLGLRNLNLHLGQARGGLWTPALGAERGAERPLTRVHRGACGGLSTGYLL